jgi:hypothetical protein
LTFFACSGTGTFPNGTLAGGGLTGLGFTSGAFGSVRVPPSCVGTPELLELCSFDAEGAVAGMPSAPKAFAGTSSGVNFSFHSGGAFRNTSGGTFGLNEGGGALYGTSRSTLPRMGGGGGVFEGTALGAFTPSSADLSRNTLNGGSMGLAFSIGGERLLGICGLCCVLSGGGGGGGGGAAS